jgi:hypothetical protein
MDESASSGRAADADREQAVMALREHAIAGRLTLEELADRVGSALTATTRAQLEGTLGDLPEAVGAQADMATTRVLGLFGDVSRSGRWRLGRRVTALGLFGGVRLDLRHAEVTAAEVWVDVRALCGAVEVVVPDGVELDMSGFAVFGAHHADGGEAPVAAGAPIVHLRARTAFGSLTVRRA